MTPISYATHLNEAVVADNKLASCSFPSRQAFPFPHQVIAYGNGLDVRSTRQVQPWHLGPASFAGTPTARIGLGRASASADNNPTGNKASPPKGSGGWDKKSLARPARQVSQYHARAVTNSRVRRRERMPTADRAINDASLHEAPHHTNGGGF